MTNTMVISKENNLKDDIDELFKLFYDIKESLDFLKEEQQKEQRKFNQDILDCVNALYNSNASIATFMKNFQEECTNNIVKQCETAVNAHLRHFDFEQKYRDIIEERVQEINHDITKEKFHELFKGELKAAINSYALAADTQITFSPMSVSNGFHLNSTLNTFLRYDPYNHYTPS